MIVRPFLLDTNESNAYVVACEQTSEALLIDAGDFEPEIVDYLEASELRLTGIFITHDHYDHTGGLPGFLARYNPRVYSGNGTAGGANGVKVKHGDTVRVGKLAGEVRQTSGHTHDSISLVFPGAVFTGDALFPGSVGGTNTPEAAEEEIAGVRKNILTLPDDYIVYAGHGPASLVYVERTANPFFVA